MYPADAHDASLLPREMRAVTGAVGFATSGVWDLWLEMYPADAHDAPPPAS